MKRMVFLGGVAILVLALAVALRQVLTPVIIAMVIAYIADPLLVWLERHRVRRLLATTVLYVLALAIITTASITLGPKIWSQGQRLYRSVSGFAQDYGPRMLATGEKPESRASETRLRPNVPPQQAGGGNQEVGSAEASHDAGDEEPYPLAMVFEGAVNDRLPPWARRARDYLHTHADEIASRVVGLSVSLSQNALKGLSNAAGFVFALVVVLVFSFFFMLHFRAMVEAVKRYIPAAQRERTLRIVGRIDGAVSKFFRGRLLVCVIAGIVYVVALRLSGIDFWLLIGLVGGALGFIPIIGVILPLIPACAFALLTGHPWASLVVGAENRPPITSACEVPRPRTS